MQREGSCQSGCGACCKLVEVNVNPAYLEKDVRHWLDLHGIKLRERGGGVWAILPIPCRELQPDMRCGLFGKPERPKLCEDWPFDQQEILTVNAETGVECGYSFKGPTRKKGAK